MMDFRRNSKVSDIKKQLMPEETVERGGGRQQEKYSMNHTPIVTVFTTVYNVAEYLPRFFRCMKKQTFKDYVLLIIDDGSEDDTYKVCGSFAAKDPRIRLVQIPHKGITAARNYAISLIRTPFAASADGDDIYGPDYLLHLVEAQKKYDADLVISRVAFHNEAYVRTSEMKRRGELFIAKENFAETLPGLLDEWRLNYLYAKLFRTDILKTTYVDESVMQGSDTMFCCQYVVKADSIVLTDDLDTHYIRYSSRSVTSYRGKDRYSRFCRIQEAVMETFREAGFLTDRMQRAVDRRILESALWSLSSIAQEDDQSQVALARVRKIIKSQIYTEAFRRQKDNLDLFPFHAVDPDRMIGSTDADCGSGRIIVSLTSRPARISSVCKVLQSIFAQTRQADEIVLWLAGEQFSGRKLPKKLVRLEREGRLSIRWCDKDLMSHMKYYYVFRKFPDDLVITVDDDLYYPPDLIEKLYCSWLIHPCAVSAARAHMMLIKDGEILPCRDWLQDCCLIGEPSMKLFAVSRAGALFPTYLFSRQLPDKDVMRNSRLDSDDKGSEDKGSDDKWLNDIWLKMMQVEAGVPVVLADAIPGPKRIPGMQDQSLFLNNRDQSDEDQCDEQLKKIISWFDAKHGEDGYILARLGEPVSKDRIIEYYRTATQKRDREIGTLQFDLDEVWNSASLKIGRVITWPGRKVRDMLKRQHM